MIGISPNCCSPRTASASAKPSMSGMSMSVTSASKRRPFLSSVSASCALDTAVTS